MARLERRESPKVRWLPSQKPGLAEAVGLSRSQLDAAAWAVTIDGRRLRGAGAMTAAVDTVLLGGWPLYALLYRVPVLRQLVDGGYALFARHRGRFGGKAACALRLPAALDEASRAELARRLGDSPAADPR